MSKDRKIAELVMNWVPQSHGCVTYADNVFVWHDEGDRAVIDVPDWHPTKNIEQAFMVVEKMRERGLHIQLWSTCNIWVVQFTNIVQKPNGSYMYDILHYQAEAATPAMAICLAAEKAMEAK